MLSGNLSRGPFRNILLSKVINEVRIVVKRRGSIFAERLTHRCLIELKGEDSATFLQGLITNDVDRLSGDSRAMYSMFLNNRGRVMFDSLVSRGQDGGTYFVECDSGSVEALVKHLKKYKLRKKVTISVLNDTSVYSVFCLDEIVDALPEPLASAVENDSSFKSFFDDDRKGTSLDDIRLGDCTSFRDPRLAVLGYRAAVARGSKDETHILNITGGGQTELYRSCRYWLGVAEGPDEIPCEHSFPLESNCDYLDGVSFHKGCYVGQELTARSHHTGVIRKRLMPILLDEPLSGDSIPDVRADASPSSKKVGSLRASLGRYGVALLRTEECLKLPLFFVGRVAARCFRPTWWPGQSPQSVKQDVT